MAARRSLQDTGGWRVGTPVSRICDRASSMSQAGSSELERLAAAIPVRIQLGRMCLGGGCTISMSGHKVLRTKSRLSFLCMATRHGRFTGGGWSWRCERPHRCIAPDHIGWRDLAINRWRYLRLQDHIANLCAPVDQLKLGSHHLNRRIGGSHRAGAMARMPERLENIVLFNTMHFRRDTSPGGSTHAGCRCLAAWPCRGRIYSAGLRWA